MKTQEELEQLLEYWEEMKKKWERLKIEFWDTHNRDDFSGLLRYNWEHKKGIEWEYKYFLEKMDGLERERFVEEYLYDCMLYSGKILEKAENEKNIHIRIWKIDYANYRGVVSYVWGKGNELCYCTKIWN